MEKTELIRKTFPFLEKELISEIAANSRLVSLSPSESMMSEGDYIKAFPMVISGTLRVTRLSEEGNELLLYYLKSGEICAMSLTCCMGLQKSNIRMTAEEESIIITVAVELPEKWMSDYRTWKEFMMYSYRRRFEELIETIDSIAFMRLDERIMRFFEERYKSTGRKVYTGTHQDIAIQLNTSREVVSRLLRTLEKRNIIVIERNSIDYSGLINKQRAV